MPYIILNLGIKLCCAVKCLSYNGRVCVSICVRTIVITALNDFLSFMIACVRVLLHTVWIWANCAKWLFYFACFFFVCNIGFGLVRSFFLSRLLNADCD